MKVYVAGPMSGRPEFNFPAFERAAVSLEVMGYEVFSPARRDLETGFDPTGLDGNEDLVELGFDLREALGADTEWICQHADAVYMLDGWELSSGARAEHALALALGHKVMLEGEPIPVAPGYSRETERAAEVREQFVETPPHRLPPREPWGNVLPRGHAVWSSRSGSDDYQTRPATRVLWPEHEWPRVIGICGKKRAGKNTAADALKDLGYEVVGFADPLKEAALDLNPIITNGVRLRPIVDYHGWEHAKDNWPEVRRILQALGTDVIRARDPEFWINAFLTRTAGRKVVVADLRFDNEAGIVRSLGGAVVEIIRPSLPDSGDTHASEAGVSRHLIDLVVSNDGTPAEMQARLVRRLTHKFQTKETR